MDGRSEHGDTCREIQRTRFLAARFPEQHAEIGARAPALVLPSISGAALETCLRRLALGPSSPPPAFSDETCLEVLAAADFLGMPEFRAVAASRTA
jgi:hypothetical protein